MSKITSEFWDCLGWGFLWLGLFGGIALIIWASTVSNYHSDEALCIESHSTWTWNQQADDWYCNLVSEVKSE